ncbi:phage portal protein family protein [Niabella sp. 22666]|uniref:phage portal protein family protein n=1 Tax=Niabella sp. 22666 TaxID=3453954 RepID=UPI003F83CBE0
MKRFKKSTQTAKPVNKIMQERQTVLQNKIVREKILLDLVEQTKYLTKQDVQRWRNAWQRALSVEWPSRTELHAVYRDVDVDNHLTGVFGQIYDEVLQKAFKITDSESEQEIPELTAQLNDAQWFIDFCLYALESEAWGYSLIQLGDIELNPKGYKQFAEVELVDRDYVIPEHHVYIRNLGEHHSSGIDYTAAPLNMWCVGVGRKNNLGLYNKVARHALAKKNMEAFWDKFGEIFGMPIRIGKTNSRNPADRNEMAAMLAKMGSAAWGLFNDDSNIEIKETTRGDAYEVYDKRIERANSEMSKAIVKQTMTADNGSSKAQGEVHLTVQQKVIEYFARLLRIVINDKLIPRMIAHGFEGWEKAVFKYDDTIELTPEQQRQIEQMLLLEYDIEPSFFIEKYNIPIIGKKIKPVTLPAPGNDNPEPGKENKPENRSGFFR